jgi:hypothetical protein
MLDYLAAASFASPTDTGTLRLHTSVGHLAHINTVSKPPAINTMNPKQNNHTQDQNFSFLSATDSINNSIAHTVASK